MPPNFFKLPKSLMFVCERDRLSILDISILEDFLLGKAEPWLALGVGPGQMFESRPIKILDRSRSEVTVVTTEYVVKLDLKTQTAFKIMPDGSTHEYRGGLREADSRAGWIPFSKRADTK